MHYPWSAFSSRGRDTLSTRRRRGRHGPYTNVSNLDVQKTELLYNCQRIEAARFPIQANILRGMRHPMNELKINGSKSDNMMYRGNAIAPIGTEGCVDWNLNCREWKHAKY